MRPERGPASSPVSEGPADGVRRRVVEAVSDSMRAVEHFDHGELRLYLALLQDRLPVYVGTMHELFAQAGQASVHKNLVMAAEATIGFYSEVLAAKMAVVASPPQLVRLRQVMKPRQIGPHQAEATVAAYLRREQELGRVAADAEPLGAARLLIGACLNYVFSVMLLGDDMLPPRQEYAALLVEGLRLSP
ncbi:TetR/AcrR family transcriptional regulator C-terminal domain-containing protein [Actinomadura sp. 9N215]|uniref:TetR/AcrR family transcriptional regulator C-terminal domain-containing protein n=1 Tax=Actinomadura sp. 9N215 TaxID=3375150 RepID=UPI00378F59BE